MWRDDSKSSKFNSCCIEGKELALPWFQALVITDLVESKKLFKKLQREVVRYKPEFDTKRDSSTPAKGQID